jgi:hypothetical protein
MRWKWASELRDRAGSSHSRSRADVGRGPNCSAPDAARYYIDGYVSPIAGERYRHKSMVEPFSLLQ